MSSTQQSGVPSTFHLVHSFLKIRLTGAPQPGLDDGTVDGVPVWQLIYFCLRCGDVGAAQEAARAAGPGLADMASLLAELTAGDSRLPAQTEAMVRLQYRRVVRQSADPYKWVVHCMLGGCDPQEKHSEVATSVTDRLWLKLCLVREDAGPDTLTLALDFLFSGPLSCHAFHMALALQEQGVLHLEANLQSIIIQYVEKKIKKENIALTI